MESLQTSLDTFISTNNPYSIPVPGDPYHFISFSSDRARWKEGAEAISSYITSHVSSFCPTTEQLNKVLDLLAYANNTYLSNDELRKKEISYIQNNWF